MTLDLVTKKNATPLKIPQNLFFLPGQHMDIWPCGTPPLPRTSELPKQARQEGRNLGIPQPNQTDRS